MPRLKKEPVYQYGIEITKPHSKAMYDHNDLVADEMKKNILNAWKEEIDKLGNEDISDAIALEREWDEDDLKESNPKLVKLQRGVTFSGFGTGYTIDDVNKEFIRELEGMANWQLHEEYSYMSFSNSLVPRTRFMMVGFEWQKHDYSFCTDKDLSPVSVVSSN
jgi:hypothetical protein